MFAFPAAIASAAVPLQEADPLAAPSEDAPTEEEIRGALEALPEDATEERAAVLQRALDDVLRAQDHRRKTDEMRSRASTAADRFAAVRDEPAAPETVAVPDGLSLVELETRNADGVAEVESARAEVETLEALAAERAARRTQIPDELAEARDAVRVAEGGASSTVSLARSEPARVLALAALEAGRSRVLRLEAERALDEAELELLPARIDHAQQRLAAASSRAAIWLSAVEKARRIDANSAEQQAEVELDRTHRKFPLLEPLAMRTLELTKLRTGDDGIAATIATASADLARDQDTLQETHRRFVAAENRVRAGGLTDAMAVTLRRDFEWLTRVETIESQCRARDRELSRSQLLVIELEEERAEAARVSAGEWLQRRAAPPFTDELQRATADLLEQSRAARETAISQLRMLNGEYYVHDRVARSLIAEVTRYREYIEQRILWVRSSPRQPFTSTAKVPSHARALAQRIGVASGKTGIERTIAHSPFRFLGLGLFIVLLIAVRGSLGRKRAELGQLVRSYKTDRFVYTLRVLAQTVLRALPLPLAMWAAGKLLVPSSESLVHAFGSALCHTALIWLALRSLRGALADRGLGSAHFRWRQAEIGALRRELRWLEPLAVVLPLTFLTLDRQDVQEWSDSIGRLSFTLWMAASALFLHRMLRPESAIWRHDEVIDASFLRRTQRLWSRLIVAIPVALGVLACLGYYYTALQFELRLRESVGFAIAIVIVNALLLRWLFITRRTLAVDQALEAKERKKRKDDEQDLTHDILEPDQVDIPAMDAQTRQLFKSSLTLAAVLGLFLIWTSVLPALQGLDRVQILPRLAIVDANQSVDVLSATRPAQAALDAGDPSAQAAPGGSIAPALPGVSVASKAEATETDGIPAELTLGDVLLALIFLMLTTVAARNLPALLELALLQRLPLDGGSRYAITTIVRYLIIVIGVSAISGVLGIGWQKIQWLAAALTFGLAFGLQEIFANFVSGLIILIERPVRVGDIVTVGTIEGRITQLRMRATTILDWDRREYLIPNKEFITGNVVNWTLSDPITRVVIPVGIAYGSDTKKARELLLKAARGARFVLDEPEPTAIFRRFGDSTLDFDLRVFIANRDLWPAMIDEVHTAIDGAFRAADIEIAFPQRDLHIRSVDAAIPVAPTRE